MGEGRVEYHQHIVLYQYTGWCRCTLRTYTYYILAAPYNADGTVNLKPAAGSSIDLLSVHDTDHQKMRSWQRDRRIRTFNSLYGEVQIAPGLKYRLNVGLISDRKMVMVITDRLPIPNTATVQSSFQMPASVMLKLGHTIFRTCCIVIKYLPRNIRWVLPAFWNTERS